MLHWQLQQQPLRTSSRCAHSRIAVSCRAHWAVTTDLESTLYMSGRVHAEPMQEATLKTRLELWLVPRHVVPVCGESACLLLVVLRLCDSSMMTTPHGNAAMQWSAGDEKDRASKANILSAPG